MQRRILLIEDEQAILEVFSLFLTRHNYVVDCAHDLDEAAAFYNHNEYSCVISDLNFQNGQMEGLDFIEKLARNKQRPKVVVCSGYATRDIEMQVLTGGADMFVAKPFAFPMLVQRLDSLLTEVPILDSVQPPFLRAAGT